MYLQQLLEADESQAMENAGALDSKSGWIVRRWSWPGFNIRNSKTSRFSINSMNLPRVWATGCVTLTMVAISSRPRSVICSRNSDFTAIEEDYYNPVNSCLNHVLERRTGIPVTLSVMYMEIARRLPMPVYRHRAPRHFVLAVRRRQLRDLHRSLHGGRTITPRECFDAGGGAGPGPGDAAARFEETDRDADAAESARRLHEGAGLAEDGGNPGHVIIGFRGPGSINPSWLRRSSCAGCSAGVKTSSEARADLEKYLELQPGPRSGRNP